MERVLEVIGLEWAVTILGSIVASVWTFFKSRELSESLKEEKHATAIEALEAGVEHTYRLYVESLKEGREDGKLTSEEKKLARQKALACAQEYGLTRGVDVIEQLGKEYIPVLIARIVRSLKGGRGSEQS